MIEAKMKKAKIVKTLCILPIVCLILCNCGSKKIAQQELGNIAGEVYALGTGLSIPDVLVSCSGVADTTDSSGSYSLLAVPVGMRAVAASREGYDLWKAFIEVQKGNNILDIYMNSATPTAKGIVFYSQRTGSTQLFVMDADGSHQEQITNLGFPIWYTDRGPVWSPDKQRIAFITSITRCSQEIMLINSDGSGLDTLVHEVPKYAQLGDWSPDGYQIVYQIHDGMPPFHYEIFIINSDGTNNLKLDHGQQPRFCGNDRVVYTAGGNIYIINTDGTGKEQLTELRVGGPRHYMPVGSPNGEKIAFGARLPIPSLHYILRVMNSDASEDTGLAFEVGRNNITEIEFSPDGQKILFLTNDEHNSEIFVINVDGSSLDSLTGGIACADGGASWSPDGNWIAFSSNREGNKDIYKVSIDGKILVQLTDDVADDFRPDW
jgi:Tol biopolymer transport system component